MQEGVIMKNNAPGFSMAVAASLVATLVAPLLAGESMVAELSSGDFYTAILLVASVIIAVAAYRSLRDWRLRRILQSGWRSVRKRVAQLKPGLAEDIVRDLLADLEFLISITKTFQINQGHGNFYLILQPRNQFYLASRRATEQLLLEFKDGKYVGYQRQSLLHTGEPIKNP